MTTTSGSDATTALQPGVDDESLWQPAQELQMVVPLLDAAKDRVGQRVTVHIAGGMQVAGKLTAVVEDDATLVVVDRDRQYDVALQSVAVIEGERS